jgi:lipopolysaccharide export system permease protein
VKIISRYILKEHIGPFVFALSALTSLLLLQVIAKQFGNLVGKGLSWTVIAEFFILSVPYTLALTMPMAMLVAVLYAFSRLAAENEVTALKAGGVSTRALMIPALGFATILAVFMLWFNDQVLPEANHELATLQNAIFRTKPTFALRPQVINTIKESNLYLRAGQIDEATGIMKDVTIYDVSDGNRRRTIYADSGRLALTPNMRDLTMHLYKGMMLMSPNQQPSQVDRIYYDQDLLKVADVANQFQSANADTTSKSDREMSICEMQKQYASANVQLQQAHDDSLSAVWRLDTANGPGKPAPAPTKPRRAGGMGAIYCTLFNKYLSIKNASADELPPRLRGSDVAFAQQPVQDTTKHKAATPPQHVAPQTPDSLVVLVDGKAIRVPSNKIPPNAYFMGGVPAGAQAIRDVARADSIRIAARNAPPAPATPPNLVKPVKPGTLVPGATVPTTNATATPAPVPAAATPGAVANTPIPTGNTPGAAAARASITAGTTMELMDAHLRLDEARYKRNRAEIEIDKKFSLAFACIVFVLVGAPLALRFPRGGVGLVIGASFFIFAVYYVCLTAGESLANNSIISPFFAMWADNIVFLIAALFLIIRMGRESGSGRGGGIREAMDGTRAWFLRQSQRTGLSRFARQDSTNL